MGEDWNNQCLPMIASRNRKVLLLREKAVLNFCAAFLITLTAEELESFRMNLAFRLGLVWILSFATGRQAPNSSANSKISS
jgi:hypothetical protein